MYGRATARTNYRAIIARSYRKSNKIWRVSKTCQRFHAPASLAPAIDLRPTYFISPRSYTVAIESFGEPLNSIPCHFHLADKSRSPERCARSLARLLARSLARALCNADRRPMICFHWLTFNMILRLPLTLIRMAFPRLVGPPKISRSCSGARRLKPTPRGNNHRKPR